MFYGPFLTKNSIITVILHFDFIWTKKKIENRFKVRSKKSKKGQIFKIYFFENKHVFLKQNLLSNPMVPLAFL